MRNKFALALSLGFFAMTINAQNPDSRESMFFYLSESFETEIPETWTIENTGNMSWEQTFDYAIATSTGNPASYVSGMLISPVVDVSSAENLRLLFDHHFWSIGSASAALEVFDGSDWVEVSFTSNYGEQDIDLTDYINDALQIRFIYDDGNTWDMYWKLFDVIIYSPEINDMAVVKVSPSAVLSGEGAIPQVTVHNYGVSEGTYDLQLTIDGTTYDQTLTNLAALASGSETIIYFPEWVSPDDNNYEITAVLTYSDDDDLSNNTRNIGCKVMPYGDAIVGHNNGKYYEVNLENGDLTHFGSFPSIPFSMADEFANGKVYRMTEWLEFWEVAVDGSLTKFDDIDLYSQWTSLGYAPFSYAIAYDWNTERMYMVGDDGAGFPVGNPHLAYFDLESFELVYVGQINNTGAMIVGMDFADDGYLYGVGLNGELYKIDVDPFEVTIVGPTGLGSLNKDFQDVSYDRASHTLYGVLRDNSFFNKFGTINIESGEFTIIQDYTDEIGFVCFAITKDFVQAYTLTFSIDDGTNPIEGAEIEINNETFATNAFGTASIELVNGEYDYTVTYSGYYDYSGTVIVEDDNEEVVVTMDVITGINTISNNFSISPNPSQGNYKLSSKTNFTFEIYDMNGIKVYSDNEEKAESIIDISEQAKGVYFLIIRTKSDFQAFKLIKN